MAETLNPYHLIGQDQTRRYWESLIRSGRFGHAHILSGHSGVGKDAMALTIGTILNCKAENNKPCGECSACRQMQNFEHPALHLIFALPRRSPSQTDPFAGIKDGEMTLINEELSKKKLNGPTITFKLMEPMISESRLYVNCEKIFISLTIQETHASSSFSEHTE